MKTQIQNFKMKVTPEQSKRVQEVIFESWGSKSKPEFFERPAIIYPNKKYFFTATIEDFIEAPEPELTYSEFMVKYGPHGGKDHPLDDMTRKEAKKMAQSRDCHCVKGKDRDNNYAECIDKFFDWHERVVKSMETYLIDPSELEIAMNAVQFDLKTHELAELINLMLSKSDVTIKDLAQLKAKWDKP